MAGVYDQMLDDANAGSAGTPDSSAPNPYDEMLSNINTPKATGPESMSQRVYLAAKAAGKEPEWFDWIDRNVLVPFGGFTEQARRGATFGLSDKVAAAVPAINQAVANAYHSLTGTTPETPPESAGQAYQDELAKQRAQGEVYAQNHPVASKVATTIGTVGGLGPAAADAAAPIIAGGKVAEVAPTLGGRVLQGAKVGGALGAMSGFGSSNDESVSRDALNTAVGAGTGAAVGGALPIIAEKGVQPVINWFGRRFGNNALENQATKAVIDRIRQSSEAGGPTAQDMLDLMNSAPDKPLTVMDVGGAPVQGLAGKTYRGGGEGQQIIDQFLNERDVGAGSRLAGDVNANISGGGSAFDVAQALQESRAAAAAPAYEQAFEGGSTAPLQDQLRNELQKATGAKGTLAKQIAQIEEENPGALAARGAAGAQTRARYMDLQSQLQQAEADRQATLAMFQKAQADATSGAPGAVWSPRIQQFLDDPIMKSGLNKGLQIQRIESVAEGKPFNPAEYAIVGTDEAGQPVVGNVPNMRLLDAGKKGLDAIISENQDPVTGRMNEYGRAVTRFKDAYLKQLDAINPDYAAARAAYSGPSQSMSALARGQQIFTKDPAEITSEFGNLYPGDQEFYRLGAASALKRNIARTGMGGDEAKKIIGNQYTQDQLRSIFPSDNAFQKFIDAATAENRMFGTKQAVLGGSQTAARLAEEGEGGSGVGPNAIQTALDLAHGNVPGAVYAGARTVGGLVNRPDPKLNAEIARLLTTSDPNARRALMARLMAAGPRRPVLPAATSQLAITLGKALPNLTNERLLPSPGVGTGPQ